MTRLHQSPALPLPIALALALIITLAGSLASSVCHGQDTGLPQTGKGSDPPSRSPNIVFIFSDDHALQAIGAYGSTVNQTPQLDRLAKEGMVFDRSFCGNSICGPSRASILTGKHSHLNGFLRNGDRFDGAQVTFPKLLGKAGYQTAMIGKWHLETDPTGFDHWEVLPGQGHYYNPDFIQMDGSRKRYEGYCTDLVTEFSLDWLDRRDPDRPFLLMTQHKAPHRNWAPHPRHFGKYKLGTIPEPTTLFDDYSGRSALLKENEMSIAQHFHWGHDMKFKGPNLYPEHFVDGLPDGEYQRMTDAQKEQWDAYYEPENRAFLEKMQSGQLSDEEITRWKYQRYMHDYLGSVAAVDDSVGRVLDYLDANGLSENTIVIYASDQGFYLGEHGWYDKRWMFEESLRMPFLMRWPGVVVANSRSDAMIQNIDYAPTFLEIAGVDVPSEVQGESFLGVLKNGGVKTDQWRDAIYYAYYENDAVHAVPIHDGVRTERYKAMYFPRSSEWNLFDLETDPQEMKSVHDVEQYKPILAKLQERYRQLRKRYDVNSAAIPATRGDESWWKERDLAKRQQAKEGGFDLVFIGDSITQGWEGAGQAAWDAAFGGVRALNLGFSGDRTEHALWRLSRGQMGPNRPKAAVVLIGTNNTGHLMQSPEEIAVGVERIIETLQAKSPQTKILLLGVLPRGATADDLMRINNDRVNELVSRLDDQNLVFYKNIDQVFLEPDGTISTEVMPDRLHLSAEGYRRWADAIVPTLREWGVVP
jgi:arylsulfatase A-like enzyme/lysophospholipase L1-like esterase